MAAVLLIVAILMFISLVLAHEWGHFVVAKRNGVEVEEFGLGFPPRAKTLTVRNKTRYTLNWLPLGGFVKLKGEHDADESDGSFGRATTWSKAKIMMAGVAMNLIVAIVLFTLLALTGLPKILDNQFTVASDTKIIRDVKDKDVVKVDSVVVGSPAAKAGIQEGDQIVKIGQVSITSPDALTKATKQNSGRKAVVIIKRDGKTHSLDEIQLNNSLPYLGVSSYSDQSGLQVRRSTWSAPIVGIGVTKDFTVATFKGLGTAVKGLGSTVAGFFTGNSKARVEGQTKASSQVSGPIGIFEVIYQGTRNGFGFIVFIIAIISLTLAIMNFLPIPALDGGRLFVLLLFRAMRKTLTQKSEELIHGTGFALLMLLILLITIVDVRRFIL